MKKFPIKSLLAFVLIAFALSATPVASVAVPVYAASVAAIGALSILGFSMPKSSLFTIINPSDITWNGKEIRELNEAIFESVFMNPAIDEFHSIVTGIEAKQQIAYLGLLGLVGKKGQGCDPSSDANTLPMSEKFWDPESIQMRLEQCWKDLNASFWVWASNKGVKRPDLTDTDFMQFIQERASYGLDEAKLRHAWFGDKDAALVTDSPAGVITAGTDLDYFNAIDGFWKQIFAIVAADPDRKASTITKNSGVSYTAQKFDSTDVTNKVVEGYFSDALDNADTRLSDRADKIFIVTKSVYDQYKRELKSYAGSGIEGAWMQLQDGKKYLTYDGVPVIPFSFQDRTIKAYQDNGTTYNLPHRIVLTTKANLQIGVESEEALSQLDVFNDKKSKKNFVDAQFLMDSKVVEDYMIQVAY